MKPMVMDATLIGDRDDDPEDMVIPFCPGPQILGMVAEMLNLGMLVNKTHVTLAESPGFIFG